MNSPVRIAVIIPFRNEATHMDYWLDFVRNNTQQEVQFIFVNDHSTDSGEHILERGLGISGMLLHLSEGEFGKKAAIQRGIVESASEYVLTLDADVQVPPNYFEELFQVLEQEIDVLILPVELNCNDTLLGDYQHCEWQYLQAITRFSYEVRLPMMCNGANLLFSRNFYLNLQRDDIAISSGDDMFLLLEAVRNKKKIGLSWKRALRVETASLQDFHSIVSQRLRWAGKASKYPFTRVSFAYAFFAFWQLMKLFFVIKMVSCQSFGLGFFSLIMVEYVGVILIQRQSYQIRRFRSHFLFLLVYPFISLGIFITSFFYKPEWKGREVSL